MIKLSKSAEAYLDGAGCLVAIRDKSLPADQVEVLIKRAELVAAEVEAKLQGSGAARDLNKAYRALRLSGEVKLSYAQFRVQKLAELARAVGRETVNERSDRVKR